MSGLLSSAEIASEMRISVSTLKPTSLTFPGTDNHPVQDDDTGWWPGEDRISQPGAREAQRNRTMPHLR